MLLRIDYLTRAGNHTGLAVAPYDQVADKVRQLKV